MNLEVATMLGNNITPERVPEVIRMLNGIRSVKGHALDAFGIAGDGLREYNGIKDTDVLALVKHIENALGFDGNDDASKLYTRRHQPFKLTNPHGTSVDTPWGKVSAIERSESTQVYVERMLRGCVGNNML